MRSNFAKIMAKLNGKGRKPIRKSKKAKKIEQEMLKKMRGNGANGIRG